MHRNGVYGPGVHVLNASIRKTFLIYEHIALDFSAISTNVVNHPSFGQPDLNIGGNHHGAITSVTQGGRNIELIGKQLF
jgi:hypothetical protein